jgi:flagellar hook-associated protein 1 FlgK
VLFSVEQVNAAFKQTAGDLKNVQSGILTEAGNDVTALNDAIKSLASTNEALRRATPGSSNAAQLLDQRDQALTTISKYIDVSVNYGENETANVTYNGAAVVDNIVPKAFAVSANTDGTLAFTLDGTATVAPQTGSLAGLATSAQVTTDRLSSVNALAVQYVTDMNSWHQGGYTNADPSVAGQPIVSGTDASSLQLLISDPAALATKSATDGSVNGNLVAISNIRGTTGVENGWTVIIAAHANLVSATNAEQSATSARNQQAQSARADVSGVDLDREAADLMRLQQAYNGCARIIQVAKESMDAIFAIF